MSLNPLTLVENEINEHVSSLNPVKQRELVRDLLVKVAKVEKEKNELKITLEKEKAKIVSLNRQILNAKFIEYRGAKFKRKPSGGYEHLAYCPACEVEMGALGGEKPYVCGKCHHFTAFSLSEITSVLNEIL